MPNGVLIPLYTWPGSTWDQVIAAKNAHPNVPVAVILNSNNGPGTYRDSVWYSWIDRFVAAGVVCYGYVWCGETNDWDGRDCTQDVALWRSFYPQVTGAFIDGFHGGYNYTGDLQLARAKAAGMYPTVGNPGMAIPASQLTGVDYACVYESAGLPSISAMQTLANTYGKDKVYVLPYGVPSFDAAWVEQAKQYFTWIYMTNDGGTNPWDTMSPYIDSLVAALDTAAPNTFYVGSIHIGKVTVSIQPQSVSLKMELWLGSDPSTKVATSGLVSFTTTGSNQVVECQITVPANPGVYHIYVDIYSESGMFVKGYLGTLDANVIESEFGGVVF